MYSQLFWEHVRQPHNRRALSDASGIGEGRFPRCGDRLTLYLNITDGRIAEATFEARACAPVIAVASLGTQMITGLTVDQARELPILELDQKLGGLPPSKRHAYLVFLECLQEATEQIFEREKTKMPTYQYNHYRRKYNIEGTQTEVIYQNGDWLPLTIHNDLEAIPIAYTTDDSIGLLEKYTYPDFPGSYTVAINQTAGVLPLYRGHWVTTEGILAPPSSAHTYLTAGYGEVVTYGPIFVILYGGNTPNWRQDGGVSLQPLYNNKNLDPTQRQLPGTYQISGTSTSVQFELRSLAVTNLRPENMVVDVQSPDHFVKILGNVTVYPNPSYSGSSGWKPQADIHWRVKLKSPVLSQNQTIIIDGTIPYSEIEEPDNDGIVASFEAIWDGRLAGVQEFCSSTFEVEARAIVDVEGGGNTITPVAKTVVFIENCHSRLLNRGASFSDFLSVFKDLDLSPFLTYDSFHYDRSPESMGYGWSSVENTKVHELVDASLVYQHETGYLRWLSESGGGYEPLFPDNKSTITKNPSSTSARYVVTSAELTRLEFDDNGSLRRKIDRNGNETTYVRDPDVLVVSDNKGRTVFHHFNSGEVQPRVVNDNPNPSLGRGQVMDYYMEGSTQKQLKSISVPMDLASPVGDKTVFMYDANGRIIEQREELTSHHRSVHYVYDATGTGRLASKKVTSTLLHPTDPLLNEVTEHSQESYEYQVPFTYGGVDYITTKIVSEDLQSPEDPEQEKAPARTFYRAYDFLSRILGEFEYVEDDENDEPIYIATLHEYNDPSDPLSTSSNPWLRTRTFQVNKGAETLFEYTARGNLKKIIDNEGNETLFSYVEEDPLHPAYATFQDLVTEVRRPAPDRDGAPSVFYPTTKFTYDPANGNLLSSEDAAGELSHFRYNPDGQVNRLINRRGFKTYLEYDGRARLSKIHTQKSKNPTPSITEYANENPADFRTVEMSYDSYDNLILTQDANGNTVEMAYDAMGRPTSVTDGNDIEQVFTYLNGVLDQVTLPNSSAGLDSLENPLYHTGRLAKTEYDSAGRSLGVVRQDSSNAAQKRVGFAYDGFSQLRSLIRTKNGVNKAHRTEYDRQGRTTKSVDANGKESTVAYEPFCVGHADTSARGVRTKSSFDTLCRLTQVEVGSPDPLDALEVASARETRNFEYDDLGRLLKTSQKISGDSGYGRSRFGQSRYGDSGSSSTEGRSYEYDSLDRMTKVTFEDGKTMEYLYDAEGNVTQVTENASGSPKVTQFSYYGDNRLYQVTYVRASGNQVFTYVYDDGGRPLTLTYPTSTGIVAHFSGPSSEVGWDGNGQLKHLRYVKDTSTLIRSFEFSYDHAGNRISQLDVTPTKATKWQYGYDWLDRLESVKKAEAATVGALGAMQLVSMYTYDAADNRIEFQVPNLNPALTETFKYSFDDADNITLIEKKVGAGAFVDFETFTPADDDGNMTSRTRDGVTTTYTWDDFNRLKAISTSDNSKKQSHTFGISGFRRKKKDKLDVETTEYAAGLATAVSKVTSGETITYLKGGGGIMGFERSSDGAMFYFLTDALSSVRDVVNSSGAVVQSYEFEPHGVPLPGSGAGSVSSAKSFHGGLSVNDDMADVGLYLMGHRFWAPELGRFLNRDPIGFAGGLNLYGAAFGNNPTTFTDPAGLQPTPSPSAGPTPDVDFTGHGTNTVLKYKSIIEAEAARTGIPPSVISAILANELAMGFIQGPKDIVAGIVKDASDVSTGIGQIKPWRARWVDEGMRRTPCDDAEYRRKLKDPKVNIAYIADLAFLNMQAASLLLPYGFDRTNDYHWLGVVQGHNTGYPVLREWDRYARTTLRNLRYYYKNVW